MVMIIVEIVVLVFNRIPALFLLHKSYRAGVFCSCLNPTEPNKGLSCYLEEP